VNVFPDLFLEHVGNDQEYEQVHDYPGTDFAPVRANGLRDVSEEINGISNELVIVVGRQLSCRDLLESFKM
jgi:hypothetical protein